MWAALHITNVCAQVDFAIINALATLADADRLLQTWSGVRPHVNYFLVRIACFLMLSFVLRLLCQGEFRNSVPTESKVFVAKVRVVHKF